MLKVAGLPNRKIKNAFPLMSIRKYPDYQRPLYDVAGLPFDAIDLEEAVRKILESIEQREPLFISTPNLNFLIAAQCDAAFQESIFHSDMCLADGMPVVWLARVLNIPIRQRVAGSDLFETLCQQSDQTVKVFFFGGPDGAARLASEKINRAAQERQANKKTAGVVCVGFESPGFGSLDDMSQPDIIQRINSAGADFIVVALGARKGQAWIERNRLQLDAPVISHLGAVVNMAAGTIARAPRWMQLTGLEWVWRIKEEPQLWRRYATDAIALCKLMLTHILPVIYQQLRHRMRGADAAEPAQLLVQITAGTTHLQLLGAWTRRDLPKLREKLKECSERAETFKVDSTGASHLDAAVRGLLAVVPKPAAN
jgi:N-acetylglucosaminyldiphosphoundecaprenol N-acetyl-beta-D-mannosaminyltransferase